MYDKLEAQVQPMRAERDQALHMSHYPMEPKWNRLILMLVSASTRLVCNTR